MRGSWWYRALSALLAVWLGVFLAEPAWLHACPVHSGGAAGGHATARAAAAAGTQSARLAGATSHHADEGHHAPAPDGRAHQCTCPGACCAVSPPALPAVTVRPTLEATVVTVDRGRPEHEYVAAWVDFVLPFATAPPAPAVLA
jgi:hypothetical protein